MVKKTISSNYLDRAMKSRDPRFARILNRLGYKTSTGKEMIKDVQVTVPEAEAFPSAPYPDEAVNVEEAGPLDENEPLEEVANEKPAEEERPTRVSTKKKTTAKSTNQSYSTRAMKAKE